MSMLLLYRARVWPTGRMPAPRLVWPTTDRTESDNDDELIPFLVAISQRRKG